MLAYCNLYSFCMSSYVPVFQRLESETCVTGATRLELRIITRSFSTLLLISSLWLSCTNLYCILFCVYFTARACSTKRHLAITHHDFHFLLPLHCCCCFNDRLFGRAVTRSILAFSPWSLLSAKTGQKERRRVVRWREVCRRVCATSTEKCASLHRFR